MWSTIRGLAACGITVFLTTQYLEEADQLADQVAVMTDGRIVAQGSLAELKQRIAGHRLDLTFVNAMEYESAVHLLDGRVLRTDPARRSASEPRARLSRSDACSTTSIRIAPPSAASRSIVRPSTTSSSPDGEGPCLTLLTIS